MEDPWLTTVRRVVSDVLDVPPDRIGPASSSDDLEAWDSLNHLRIILALEEEFQVRFTPEESAEMLSVEAIVSTIAAEARVGSSC